MAIAVHDASLIAYLVDIFERSWERAQPFTSRGNQVERNIAADVRAMTIRMLVEGHSDPASAKRLGVSTRTYAGYIAELKDEFGVQTRFQLGYAMGARPAAEAPDHRGAAGRGLRRRARRARRRLRLTGRGTFPDGHASEDSHRVVTALAGGRERAGGRRERTAGGIDSFVLFSTLATQVRGEVLTAFGG